MSKVTNNENMRRYVHMKLSNGGSGSGSGGSCTCLPPMIVDGTVGEGLFTPNDDMPSFTEAVEHMRGGGLLYVYYPISDTNYMQSTALSVDNTGILVGIDTATPMLSPIVWANPEDEGSDTPK